MRENNKKIEMKLFRTKSNSWSAKKTIQKIFKKLWLKIVHTLNQLTNHNGYPFP